MTTQLQNLGSKNFTLSKKDLKNHSLKDYFFLRKQVVLVQENPQHCQYKNDIFKNICVSDKTLNGDFFNRVIHYAPAISYCGNKCRVSPYV